LFRRYDTARSPSIHLRLIPPVPTVLRGPSVATAVCYGSLGYNVQSVGNVMNIPLSPIRCLYRGVDLYGRKTGIVSGNCRYTYAEFGERAERLTAGLRAVGLRSGDRVAYLSFNINQLLEGYYGVVMAHGIVMPLNVRLTPAELSAILNHAEARILIFENDFSPIIEHLRKNCPCIEQYITINEKTPLAD